LTQANRFCELFGAALQIGATGTLARQFEGLIQWCLLLDEQRQDLGKDGQPTPRQDAAAKETITLDGGLQNAWATGQQYEERHG
jgi:hypothetical protein